MELWQEVLYLIAAWGWWRIALVFVAITSIGILVGISCGYLTLRFVNSVKNKRVKFLDIFYHLFSKKPKIFTSSGLARQFINTTSASPEVHEPEQFPISELIVEFEHNCRIITEFSGDNLLPLQSDVWDAQEHLAHKLSLNLREQLALLYADIHVLNAMVSFLTGLDNRSSSWNDIYRKRLTSISERLQEIRKNI